MEPYIRSWHEWMQASGSFCDYQDTDGMGRLYEVRCRSIHRAMRVCREWGSLLLNDKTQVVCDAQECTDWLATYLAETGLMPAAQATVVCAFGMGTEAWAPGRTRAFCRGKAVDQLQMHLRGESEYRIETVRFDEQGNEVEPVGVCPEYETGSEWPTFAIVKPAIDNTRVDMSPYGQ
ncbi:hypothetical protein [Collinsella ihumii]|uniref:hypothetical protein n=1 Tax=Collinsella ihumii TaxID=1720204 RepID=UPI00082D79F2|nr:hypothetical protein [Collinsella ihumii]